MTKDIPSSEDFDLIYSEILEEANGAIAESISLTQELVLFRNDIAVTQPYWTTWAQESPPKTPHSAALLTSGYQTLESSRDMMRNTHTRTRFSLQGLPELLQTAGTFAAVTSSTASVMPGQIIMGPELKSGLHPFAPDGQWAQCLETFEKLDPPLADTYQQIGEVLYATQAAPERAALFMARQTFDHLFEILAPDEEVRESAYWQPKEGDRADRVTRMERIEYAAHTNIHDVLRAQAMAGTAKQMVANYRLLNSAHCRGELDPDKAQRALVAAERIFLEWGSAIEQNQKD